MHATKQGAKATAAKEAVLWLRANGKLPEAGIKRQKVADPQDLREGQTGLTQIMKSFGVESTTSIPQRVHERVKDLGLYTPTYDLKPSTTASGTTSSGHWDVAAIFDERDIAVFPALAGRIGEAKNVHGKQKAKDACCEKVLQSLELIQLSRG